MTARLAPLAPPLDRLLRQWGLRPVLTLDRLSGLRGCYLLAIAMTPSIMRVGGLGRIRFIRGLYGYVGSARGRSVTLAHRLARHLRRDKIRRWHIDFLTSHANAQPVAAYVSLASPITEGTLARLCASRFPAIAGFGNSDRRDEAAGHLFLLQPAARRESFTSARIGR
ncbi:MAG: GIY-YIG nuclease family protein [Nitrospirota bacterium]